MCSKDCIKKEIESTINFNTETHVLTENDERISEMIQYDNNDKWKKCYLVNKDDIKENINFDVKYKMLNHIKYPINFYIINEEYYYTISNKEIENKKKPFLISSLKGYIIIKNNENNNIFYVCSLKERFHFEVDFIFVFFIYQEDNYLKINDIIEKIKLENKQNDNKIIFLKGECDDIIGFYFKCKKGIDSIIDIDEKIENNKLYNIYKDFMNSINEMENNCLVNITTDEIDKIINQNKSYPLFIFDHRIFEKFLKGISIDFEQSYQNDLIATENTKRELINVDNNYSLYFFYNIIDFNKLKNKKQISLITEQIFLPSKINDIRDKLVYLLLINNEYYLYFKAEKKILNIKKSNDPNNNNIWDIIQILDVNKINTNFINKDNINDSDININININNNNSIDNNDINNNNFKVKNNNDNNSINNDNYNDGNNITNNNFSNNSFDNNNNNLNVINNNDSNINNNDNNNNIGNISNNENSNINNDNDNNNNSFPIEDNNGQNLNEFNYDNLDLKNIDNNYQSTDEQNKYLSSSIIEKLVKLYYNDIYYKSKIEKKEIERNEYGFKLINRDWINKYKDFYKYSEVTKDLPYIDINNDIWNNIPNVDKDIIQESKFPEELKISEMISPKIFHNESFLEYPTNIEVIQEELFTSLLKEDNDFDNYEIQSDNNSYNCLLGDNHIFIFNNNSPNLLIFIFDKNENQYNIKFAVIYSNQNLLNDEINEIINAKYLENYLFNKDLNIASNQPQKFKEGTFIKFNQEKLGIKKFIKPPLIGLANIGATCYMNATLQCLSNIDTLTNYVLIYQKIFSQNVIKYDLTNEYAKLVKNLWDENNAKKYYEPYDFKDKIGQKNPLFSGIAANDSKDLILFIFQEMHKELNNININNLNFNGMNNLIKDQRNEKGEYKIFLEDYYSANNSIIQKLFYGEQESINICHNCNVKMYNFNIFSFLIFPLEKVRQYIINMQTNGFDKVTLKDCFDHYTSEEILSGENQMYCNYCNQNADYSTYNKIYKHPEILVIILNRGNGLEFDVEFEYPKKISINDYINFDNNSNYNNNEDIKYELIGIIAHLGDSSMSGHFISICKNPVDKKWYKFNDAIVSESSSELDSDDNLNNIPYVLFYKIISSNIPNGNQITLYFDFSNDKQLYLNLDENTIFIDAINLLIEEYELPQDNYKCYKGFIELEQSKSIKDNLLNNGDHVKIETDDDFNII